MNCLIIHKANLFFMTSVHLKGFRVHTMCLLFVNCSPWVLFTATWYTKSQGFSIPQSNSCIYLRLNVNIAVRGSCVLLFLTCLAQHVHLDSVTLDCIFFFLLFEPKWSFSYWTGKKNQLATILIILLKTQIILCFQLLNWEYLRLFAVLHLWVLDCWSDR